MSIARGLCYAVVLGAVSALSAPARANVNLELRYTSTIARVGDTVEIGIYAVSDDETSQTFTAVDVIIDWDPVVLRLDGKTDNGFGWTSSNFPCDGCLAQLNFDCCCQQIACVPVYTGLPANDGDAFFQAWHLNTFPPLPQATPAGALLTTILFTAIGEAVSTNVAFLGASGVFAVTRVIHTTPETGTLFLTGALGSTSLTVAACGTRGDFDSNCRVDLDIDYPEFLVCLDGPDGALLPPACDFADFNGDGFVDMLDAVLFLQEFTGP